MRFEIDTKNALERFRDFFGDVPLHSGREWETLEVGAIVAIFRAAAQIAKDEYQAEHDEAVRQYEERTRLGRWWAKSVCGWEAPYVPSLEELYADMAQRCRDLADWMNQNQHRPFYMDSDMSSFIWKPRAVSCALLKTE